MREFFEFECVECRCRNYTSTKNRKAKPQRVELSKFCSSCRRHTVHRERK